MRFSSDVLQKRYSYIYSNKVKKDIRIVSLSDTHIDDLTTLSDIDKMISFVKKEKPNYICLLGDTIDYPQILLNNNNVEKCKRLFKGLSKITKLFIILGNHDFINLYEKELHENYNSSFWNEISEYENVYLLNNKRIELKDIVISGYFENKNIYYEKKINEYFYNDFINIEELNKEEKKYSVLLLHNAKPLNDEKNQDIIKDYDLVLCGHYHNGCVPSFLEKVLPKNFGIIAPDKKMFKNNLRGIKKLKNNYIIYNGGWVKINNRAPFIFKTLDKMCNKQIDITTITNDKNYEPIKIKTEKEIINRKD